MKLVNAEELKFVAGGVCVRKKRHPRARTSIRNGCTKPFIYTTLAGGYFTGPVPAVENNDAYQSFRLALQREEWAVIARLASLNPNHPANAHRYWDNSGYPSGFGNSSSESCG